MTTRLAFPLSLTLALSACGTSQMGQFAKGADGGITATSTTGTVGDGGGDDGASTDGMTGGTDAAIAIPANAVSIKTFHAACDGTTDDHDVLVNALAAAADPKTGFPLLIDCTMLISSGQNPMASSGGIGGVDIERPVFIDNGTQVYFSPAGEFIVDNLFIPAFVIADSSNILIADWNIEWRGQLPITGDTGGFWWNGSWNAGGGTTQPAGGFNNFTLTEYLTKSRGIKFAPSTNNTSLWAGGMGPMALFYITGDSSNVTVTGLNAHAPADATVDKFVPLVVSLTPNYKSNQTLTTSTPQSGMASTPFVAMPHGLTFSNITLDGTYFGFLGGAQNSTFEHITSKRYGDIQNADFSDAGGNGSPNKKWFAPPHLFYINYLEAPLNDTMLTFIDIDDQGPRVGVARDTAADKAADELSGVVYSFKLGCNTCTVDGYKSARPDGFMDALTSTNVTISNVTATYDSSFINNVFPGWRFPSGPDIGVTFKNVTLTDTATTTTQPPLGGSGGANMNLMFDNVNIIVNAWQASAEYPSLAPIINGQGNPSAVHFAVTSSTENIVYAANTTVTETFTASATTVKAGGSITLSWSNVSATSCTGSWSKRIASNGSETLTLASAGTQSFVLTCTDGTNETSATIPVTVTS